MTRILILLCLLPILAACSTFKGPTSVPGIKSVAVTVGQLSELRTGGKLLVVAPFTHTKGGYYLCRGEDAANFVESLAEEGLFDAQFYFDDNPELLLTDLIEMSPEQIKQQLQLDAAPDMILSGVITKRKVLYNVFSDVTMDAAFRLTFFDLLNAKKTVVEADVHENFEFVVPAIVQFLADRLPAQKMSKNSSN